MHSLFRDNQFLKLRSFSIRRRRNTAVRLGWGRRRGGKKKSHSTWELKRSEDVSTTHNAQVFPPQPRVSKTTLKVLETDGGIKQPVMLLSNHCHMCWEGGGVEGVGGGGPSLKSRPTKLLPLHVNKHMHTPMSRISTNATVGKRSIR